MSRHPRCSPALAPAHIHGLGRKAESDAALRELFESVDDERAYRIAEALAFRGQPELAFERLRASDAEWYDNLLVPFSPFPRTLRTDPGWTAWMESAQSDLPSPHRKG